MKKLFFILLMSLISKAHGEKSFMSPLDTAYAEALKSESAQSAFYNAFFNTEIFIPTHNLPESEERKRAGDDESISPIFVESEGVQYLMLFDSEERLSAWAQKEVGFVALPGHAIVEMMNTEIHWALNVGTEYMKTFVPDEIKWLKETVSISTGNELKVTKGTNVLIGEPAIIPEGLVESLIINLSRNTEVKSAYLGQMHIDKQSEEPHLALVLELADLSKSSIEAIRKDISFAIQGLLGESEYIDIMIKSESKLATEITNVVNPFYIKSMH